MMEPPLVAAMAAEGESILAEVDDRGVHWVDPDTDTTSFVSWRNHIREGAALAAALAKSDGSACAAYNGSACVGRSERPSPS